MPRLLILLLVLPACASSLRARAPYQRPTPAALRAAAREVEPGLVDDQWSPEPHEPPAARQAWNALWAGIGKAQAQGMTEMYGVEIFGGGDGGYDAVFFVRMADGRVHCLMTEDELHAIRKDKGSVPAVPADRAAFELLRRRVAPELPLGGEVDLGTEAEEKGVIICDGALHLVHAYRDGRSDFLLWYQPTESLTRRRNVAEVYTRGYPVLAILNALYAALPAERLPTFDDEDEWYDRTPGFPGRSAGGE